MQENFWEYENINDSNKYDESESLKLDKESINNAQIFCEKSWICKWVENDITKAENEYNPFLDEWLEEDRDVIWAKEQREIFDLLNKMLTDPNFKEQIKKHAPELWNLTNEEISSLNKICELIFADNKLVWDIVSSVTWKTFVENMALSLAEYNIDNLQKIWLIGYNIITEIKKTREKSIIDSYRDEKYHIENKYDYNKEWYNGYWYNVEWYDVDWYDFEWYDKNWYNTKWYDDIWYNKDWYNELWYNGEWIYNIKYDKDWYSELWYDREWFDITWYNEDWYDNKWYGKNWYNIDWYDIDWYNKDWYDNIWYNKDWYDKD